MAVFGRRQPHAPLILRGLAPAQPPVGVVRVVGQKASQAAADRYYRRAFAPKIVRAGGAPPAAARSLCLQRVARDASRRPQSRLIVLTQPAPPPSVTAPVAVLRLFGQKAGQAAADRYFRRALKALVVRGGGPLAVGRLLAVGQKASQHAADRYYRRAFPPLARPAVAPRPVARVLVCGQRAGQHAADRFFRRSFAPLVARAGGPAAVARLISLQKVAQPAGRRPQSRLVVLTQPAPQPAPPPDTTVHVDDGTFESPSRSGTWEQPSATGTWSVPRN